MVFSDLKDQIKGDQPTYSNGAVYADFDNDGDLDIIVNNIDAPVLLYANKANDVKAKADYLNTNNSEAQLLLLIKPIFDKALTS